MQVTIELTNEQIAALKTQAEAQGLTVEDWLQKMSEQYAPIGSVAHLQKRIRRNGRGCFTHGRKAMTVRRLCFLKKQSAVETSTLIKLGLC